MRNFAPEAGTIFRTHRVMRLAGNHPCGGLLISLVKTLVTADATRRRAIGQILLLAAGFLVLVAISVASVILVNQARDDNGWVVHTVEVENQINTVLLEIRRAESAARGYLLTSESRFLTDHETAIASIVPDVDKLIKLTSDNPVQTELANKLRSAVGERLAEFAKAIDFVKRNDTVGGVAMLRDPGAGSVGARDQRGVGGDVRRGNPPVRTAHGKSRPHPGSRFFRDDSRIKSGGRAGRALDLPGAALGAGARRSRGAIARQQPQSGIDRCSERTADLREANEEIQRFAYIVSHDLRSPLVNIMGFTSELEELRGDIFKRIATLGREASSAPLVPDNASDDAEPALEGADKQLSQDFTEALGFIKSSIGKMDRLITAILNLTREGRREFQPVPIDTRELIEGIVSTVAHQAAEANAQVRIEPLPEIVSDRLALEQIFSNLIDNALKYLKPGVPGDIAVRGRTKLGFAIFEIADNGRGIDPKDHQRIFDLFRRAGTQDRPGQGIGLAHVRALVRRLGGTMSVASELHNGSTFTITLPLTWAATNRNRES